MAISRKVGVASMNWSLGPFFHAWSLVLFVIVNLAAALAWYAWAARRVGGRDPAAPWPLSVTACYAAGITILAIAYVGPLAAWSHTFFWVHMTQHLLVMMAAAPLIVLGAPITLAFRASGPQSRRRWVVPILRSRAVRLLTHPVFTWILFASALLLTHFTAFYNWALVNHDADQFIQQPLFLGAALLYYLPLIGANLQPRRPPQAMRLLSLALMMIPEAIVGAVIYFSPTILYPAFPVDRPFGLGPQADQQLAGALMWALVMVVDSFWMMYVAAEWFASEEKRGERFNRDLVRADDVRQ
ncbi:MAG: cytochrome c oxidase assembly protein [Actinobacteria bacterium]|jgi:cytochrome c oxidase assembly factor CtaG|nr:cytochrome c oxidase assembly protein [Actinomycetota bacterium]